MSEQVSSLTVLFQQNINSKIEGIIKSKVPSAVDSLISSEGNKLLQDLTLKKRIDKWAQITFDLTQNPFVSDNILTVPLSGEFIPTPK